MNKGAKRQILHDLENVERGVKEHPLAARHTVAYVIDGMAVFHTIKNIPKTFGDIAETSMNNAEDLYQLPNVRRVVVVFDIYHDHKMSIK